MRRNISQVAAVVPAQPRLLVLDAGAELAGMLDEGFVVERVADPPAALRAAERQLPDAVVVAHDDRLRDARSLCAALRGPIAARALPVVAIAGASSPAAAVAAYEAGLDHWFEPPVDATVLRARLRALVASAAGYRAIEAKARSLMTIHDWVRYLVHDLRSPLAVALGNVDLSLLRLAELQLQPIDVVPVLEDSLRALRDADRMIANLLDSDRLRHGALDLRLAEVDLARVVEEAAEGLRVQAERRRRPIQLHVDGPTTLLADGELIRRVCANLVENAIRHATQGPVRVDVRGAADAVVVRVANRAQAIDEGIRDSLFDPWADLSKGSSSVKTGLGLSFSRMVVEAHGGWIRLEAASGDEVVFSFSLPRRS